MLTTYIELPLTFQCAIIILWHFNINTQCFKLIHIPLWFRICDRIYFKEENAVGIVNLYRWLLNIMAYDNTINVDKISLSYV